MVEAEEDVVGTAEAVALEVVREDGADGEVVVVVDLHAAAVVVGR